MGDHGAAGSLHHLRDVSRRSIDQLIARCDDDPKHSAHVARLAVALFDALAPVHGLDGTAREYLEAGALLANVGLVVAHTKHHLHAYYVIRNSELAGLTDAEIEVIAQIARYHRKSEPKASHAEFAALSAGGPATRPHAGRDPAGGHRAGPQPSWPASAASKVELRPRRAVVVVEAEPGATIGLELYAANERKELLEQVRSTGAAVERDSRAGRWRGAGDIWSAGPWSPSPAPACWRARDAASTDGGA